MYLVIDIGGTKTLIALFSSRGHILRKSKFKTALSREDFLRNLFSRLTPFTKYPVSAIVVAVPGLVQKNCSISLGNREKWGSFSVNDWLKNVFNCPIYLENDASLAAFFEAHNLPGKVIFLTFSTGIGGGIVKDNRLLPESAAFEPGHIIYNYKNQTAEWEDIASSKALETAFKVKKATSLRGQTKMQEVASRISLGLPYIIQKYQPDIIILGGPLGKIFHRYSKYLPNFNVRLIKPRRPLESVIYGGFLYAKTKELAKTNSAGLQKRSRTNEH